MRRRRNFKAEYARRKALAKKRGLSPSQARGHPKPHEAPVSAKASSPRWSRILERGVGNLRSGMTLTAAAKAAGVSTERLRAYVAKTGIATKKGRTWVVGEDHRTRRMLAITTDGAKRVEVKFDEASLVGAHANAVGQFLESNDDTLLKPFRTRWFVDTAKKRHMLETNPNALYRLASAGTESFEAVYKIVQ